jgi:signal peptidase I
MFKKKTNQYYYNKKQKKIITPRLIKEIFSWLTITLVAVVIATALVLAFGMQVKCIGDSMEPAIAGGQGVFVDRVLSKIASPKVGDVIVFLPNGNVNSHYYVKRVVATPGDTVQIIDGSLYVNGIIDSKESKYDKMQDAGIAENEIKLKSGEYFVLGDNRNSSEDSRSANIGIVGQSMIIGRAWYKLAGEEAERGLIPHY